MRPQVLLPYLLGGVFLFIGVRAIKSGQVKCRGSVFYRSTQPLQFWLGTGLFLFAAAICFIAPILAFYVL